MTMILLFNKAKFDLIEKKQTKNIYTNIWRKKWRQISEFTRQMVHQLIHQAVSWSAFFLSSRNYCLWVKCQHATHRHIHCVLCNAAYLNTIMKWSIRASQLIRGTAKPFSQHLGSSKPFMMWELLKTIIYPADLLRQLCWCLRSAVHL